MICDVEKTKLQSHLRMAGVEESDGGKFYGSHAKNASTIKSESEMIKRRQENEKGN